MVKLQSKVILHAPDAVNLIRRGDLLLIDHSLKRIQGAYIDDKEVKELCEGISKKYINGKTYFLPNAPFDLYEDEDHLDELLKETVDYLFDSNWVSVSALQRKFRVGYNRASRIMDQLKDAGIISEPPRKLLVSKEKAEEILYNFAMKK